MCGSINIIYEAYFWWLGLLVYKTYYNTYGAKNTGFYHYWIKCLAPKIWIVIDVLVCIKPFIDVRVTQTLQNLLLLPKKKKPSKYLRKKYKEKFENNAKP